MNRRLNTAAGFTMIEVLVTLVIIAVGLLGLVALQARAQQAEMESYQRTQALILRQDMIDRITINREAMGCYAISSGNSGGTDGTSYLGTGNTTAYDCASQYGSTIVTSNRANQDLAEWDSLLKGASTTADINGDGTDENVGAMIGARGCITYDDVTELYTVAVAWQGLSNTTAPTNTCGSGLYGDEKMRRVVVATIMKGKLD